METVTMSRAGKSWTAAEESSLLQLLMLGFQDDDIAEELHRKVGGINARRYVIAERLISQGATIAQAADIVKWAPEDIQAHLDKKKVVVTPPPPPPKEEGISMALIHRLGRHIGLSMDEFVGKVHTWENTEFLTFRSRETPKGKSIYTLNLKTLRPTQTSPIQKQLNAELELAFDSVTA
jgi:hypothetical protein